MGSIRNALADAPADPGDRWLWAASARICLAGVGAGTSLDRREALADRSVVVATGDPLAAALTLIELDGFVRRLLLCVPDVPRHELALLAARAGADAIVTGGEPEVADLDVPVRVRCTGTLTPAIHRQPAHRETEWVLLTSGTAGAPKLVRHSFATLTGAIARPARPAAPIVWGTFYDIRRYGGLQILLRALVGGGSLVFSGVRTRRSVITSSGSPNTAPRTSRALRRTGAALLMSSGRGRDRSALYKAVRRNRRSERARRAAGALSGRAHRARLCVDGGRCRLRDGRRPGRISRGPRRRAGRESAIRVDEGALRIRSNRTALGYVGEAEALADPEGFVDTGDMVERRGDRYYFPRPPQRRHQHRRTEGPSRGGGGGDQPPPAGPHVESAVRNPVRSPARS